MAYGNVFLAKENLIEIKKPLMFNRWSRPLPRQGLGNLQASGVMNWWDGIVLNLLARLRIQNTVPKFDREHHESPGTAKVMQSCGEYCCGVSTITLWHYISFNVLFNGNCETMVCTP